MSLVCSASFASKIKKLHEKAYSLLDTDPNVAMIMADSSLVLAQEADLVWEEANSLYIKGYIYKHKKALPKAVVSYLNAAQILDGLNDKRSALTHTSVLLNVGDIFRKYHKHEEAIELLEKGLEISQKWSFEKQELKLLYNKASVLYFQGRLNQALMELKLAFSLASQQNDGHRLIKCWNLFGLIYKESGQYSLSKDYYQRIVENDHSSAKDLAMAFHNLGLVYQKESFPDSARLSFEFALKKSLEINDAKTQFISLYALAEWHSQEGNLSKAKVYGRQAEDLYLTTDQLPEEFAVFHVISLIYHGLNQYSRASSYSIRYYDESQRFYNEVKEVIQAKDKFHMDLLLAGIKAEQKAKTEQKSTELYRWLTAVGVLLIILILISWKIWFRWWRKNLWNKVHYIFSHKNQDGSYKSAPFDGFDN